MKFLILFEKSFKNGMYFDYIFKNCIFWFYKAIFGNNFFLFIDKYIAEKIFFFFKNFFSAIQTFIINIKLLTFSQLIKLTIIIIFQIIIIVIL